MGAARAARERGPERVPTSRRRDLAAPFERRTLNGNGERRTCPPQPLLGSVSQSMGWKAFLCFAILLSGA